jgi:hypothetical protein
MSPDATPVTNGVEADDGVRQLRAIDTGEDGRRCFRAGGRTFRPGKTVSYVY